MPDSFSFLEGASIIKYDEANDLILAYKGGTGIHVYDPNGKEVSYWQIDSLSNTIYPAQVKWSMQKHIDQSYYP